MLDKAASSATGRALIALILALVILMPVAYSVVARVAAGGAEGPEEAKGTKCVEPIEYMRFHHWELLRGLREKVVRDGDRGDVSLDGCWDCHTSKVGFCDRCHDAATVRPDCFDCHYYPDLDE